MSEPLRCMHGVVIGPQMDDHDCSAGLFPEDQAEHEREYLTYEQADASLARSFGSVDALVLADSDGELYGLLLVHPDDVVSESAPGLPADLPSWGSVSWDMAGAWAAGCGLSLSGDAPLGVTGDGVQVYRLI